MSRKLECMPEIPDFVCVGCPGLEELQHCAEDYLHASSSVSYPIELPNGQEIEVEVPRRSVFDHPRTEQVRRIFTVIYSNLGQQQTDVLQCAEQCRLLPAQEKFNAASNTVSVCRRQVVSGRREDDFYQIWSLKSPETSDEDHITTFIDDILPLESASLTD